MKKCSKGHSNPDNAIFCAECGEKIVVKSQKKKCSSCHAENPNDAEFCHNCGHKFNMQNTQEEVHTDKLKNIKTETSNKVEHKSTTSEPKIKSNHHTKESAKEDESLISYISSWDTDKRYLVGSILSIVILLCVSLLYNNGLYDDFCLKNTGAALTCFGGLFIGVSLFSNKRRFWWALSGIIFGIIFFMALINGKYYWGWFILVTIGYIPIVWGLFSKPTWEWSNEWEKSKFDL